MRRFVIRYQGKGPAPAADVARLRSAGKVLDEGGPGLFLLELGERRAGELSRQLPGWLVVPELTVPRPEARARVQRAAPRKAAKPA